MRAKHLLAIAMMGVLPATGQAQLGGLIKKAAKSAAEGRVVASAANQNVRSSETFGPELTASSLDAVIRGLAASDAKLAEAKQLHEEKDRLYIRSSQLAQAHDGDRGRYNDRVRTIEQCQDSVVHVRSDAAREAYMARMKNDPAAQQEMMRASMAVSQQAAAAPNDTARVKKLMQNLAKAQGIDPVADSAAAIKVCGAKPQEPAALVQEDSVKARINRLESQVRDVENGADAAGSTASGMSRRDYALARERVVNWYAEFRSGHPVQAFGGDERKLLDSRRADIEKYKRALQ